MIVATPTFDALKFLALGGFVASVLAGAILIPKNLDPSSERAKKIRGRALAVFGLLVAVALPAFALEPFGAPVVIVKIASNGASSKTRGTLFGASTYAFQDGHTATMTKNSGQTTIVNDSSKAMRIELQSYGDATMAMMSHLVDAPAEVPPMAITTVDHAIDFVGADDPPPAKVQGVYAEDRYWLVW